MHRTARSTAWVFALLAALFTAGCEVFTIDDPNQADRVNPADPTETGSQPAQPASEDTTSIAENASSAVLVGGDGIGPRGAGGGFLWKPISENTGKLVVLLPPPAATFSPFRVEIDEDVLLVCCLLALSAASSFL